MSFIRKKSTDEISYLMEILVSHKQFWSSLDKLILLIILYSVDYLFFNSFIENPLTLDSI